MKRFEIKDNIHWRDCKLRLGIHSKSEDDETSEIVLIAFGKSMKYILPKWASLRPILNKVYPKDWANRDKKYYTEIIMREYSFAFTDEHFSMYYGGDYNDSSDGSWYDGHTFITYPWKDYTHIRHTLYNFHGVALTAEFKYASDALEKGLVTPHIFNCNDFDGEFITVKAHKEEREWHLGRGFWKWLKYFSNPLIRTSLCFEFDKETGKRKGSYKGGTTDSSIDMLPNESYIEAFRRYCIENNMIHIYSISDALDYIDCHSEHEILDNRSAFKISDTVWSYMKGAISINKQHLKQLIYKTKLETV